MSGHPKGLSSIDPSIAKGIVLSGDAGAVPQLQWIAIDKLVVDMAYQRSISGRGRKNVRDIAANFRWSRFSPVIVSPVVGGRYAIIDGQHRCTAAAARGYLEVPCQVIIADQREQADAFKAINGHVTAIGPLQVHASAVVAGDAEALEIERICKIAQVRVLRSNRTSSNMKAGDTCAVHAIKKVRRSFGDQILLRTLQSITLTSNNVPGAVNSVLVSALAAALAELPDLVADPDHLFAIIGAIELEREIEALKFSGGRLAPSRDLVQHLIEVIGAARLRGKKAAA